MFAWFIKYFSVSLKFELRRKPKPEVQIDENALQRAELKGFKNAENQYAPEIRKFEIKLLKLQKQAIQMKDLASIMAFGKPNKQPPFSLNPPKVISVSKPVVTELKPPTEIVEKPTPVCRETDNLQLLGKCERAIYSLLYNNPGREFSKQNVAIFTGYSHRSGGTNNAIYHLCSMKLINRVNKRLSINEDMMHEGSELLGDDINLYEEFTIENWGSKLRKCERTIFKFLMDNPDQEFSKEEIGEQTGYSYNSGGFNNAIYRLNSLGLIKREGLMIKLNEEILER